MTAMLRGQIADIVSGSVFLFTGLATVSIATIRINRRGARIFFWLGIWSATYGAVQLTDLPSVVAVAPHWLQISAPFVNTALTYLLVAPASFAFLELSLGGLRRLMQVAASVGLAIAVSGIIVFALTGSRTRLMLYNNLLAACVLPVLVIVAAAPKLSARYLAIQNHRVLAVGTIAFAVEALYNSLSRPLGFESPHLMDHFGFGMLLFAFGYVAVQQVFANERRLVAVENELDIARKIQASILPGSVPALPSLRISAAYQPMTAVAGDFYDFICADERRVGILVADVAGHGVPAALIASMIKVALQSVTDCADDPGAVLRSLNHILAGQTHSQFVSAAYVWFDMESRTARYSAAGHPPLLRWKDATLERIESNGFLFGMFQESDYPVFTMSIDRGERFVLYTDGVSEAENGRGDYFGDVRFEEVVRAGQRKTAAELSEDMLFEIGRWRPHSAPQQDDITLVIIDVVESAVDPPPASLEATPDSVTIGIGPGRD